MIRSRTPIVLATIIIWAIIFCIYYLGKSSRDLKAKPVVLVSMIALLTCLPTYSQSKAGAVLKSILKSLPRANAKAYFCVK